MTREEPATKQPRPVVLLHPVPGDSVIHRLWAGTKLLTVFVLSALLTFYPGWVGIGAVAAVVVLAAALARIPFGVLPSVPKVLWLLIAFGAFTAALSGGEPIVQLFDTNVALGGLLTFTRVTTLAVVLLGLSMMVSWTTNVAEIAPALATLGRPLKFLRIPVDEWAVAIALALRSFPMLIEEFRVLYAARKLRPRMVLPMRRMRWRRFLFELVDMLVAAITAALRRADEMGDAITARGGMGQISASTARPGRSDAVALAIVALVCVAVIAL
ncbi:MAG: energy-coupling factor transporter transmembrane protein EcfT [Mycobacterium sp.]|nr:energy-coupling factor transporter transmembrane protein EcfT [Mycobacterium sp.]